jgi:hypothetical protein
MDSLNRVVIIKSSMSDTGVMGRLKNRMADIPWTYTARNREALNMSTMPKNRGRDKIVSSKKIDKYRVKAFDAILRLFNLLDFWTGRPLQLVAIIKKGDSMFIPGHLVDEFLSSLKFPDPEKCLKGASASLQEALLCSGRKRCRIERARRQRVRGRNRKCIDMVIKEAKKIVAGDF